MNDNPADTTILAVDDERANLYLLREILSGYTVIFLEEPAEVLPVMKRRMPDLVLLDIMMPGLDGFAVAKSIKEDGILKSVPIIFISARGSGEDVSAGLEIGAVDYIRKPYDEQEVLARVRNALRIAGEHKDLYRRATRDALTGLYNRSYFMEMIRHEFTFAERTERLFSLAIIDLDRFKSINDGYGHQAGDQVLKYFAEKARSLCREYDIIARYGGEEFVVYLPDLSRDQAGPIIDRVRVEVGDSVLDAGLDLKITFSAGVADSAETGGEPEPLEKLLSIADSRLYKAKSAGRNRVVISD